jgi:lipoprotein
MIRKKLFAVLIYVLACCTVLSACISTTKEETEQSSEKKDKEKSKKSKDKDDKKSKEDTKKESEESKENLSNKLKKDEYFEGNIDDAKREELKAQTVEILDTMLASEALIIMWEGIGNGIDGKITLGRYLDGDRKIYFLSANEDDPSKRLYTMTDTNRAYISYDTKNWGPAEEKERLNGSTLLTSSYPSYLSLIYAVLEEGFDIKYLPETNMYEFESNAEKIKDVDIHSISSKINNKAQYDEFAAEFVLNDINTKSYALGIAKKVYRFTYENGTFLIMEELYDKDDNKFETSILIVMQSSDPNIKDVSVEMFNAIDGNFNGQ